MRVFPAVDILGGKCVQLVQGDKSRRTIYGSPLVNAERWIELGADSLHIINLDGAFGDSSINAGEIKKIINETGVFIELGGGIRTLDDARSWLDLGIDRVILSTFAVSNPKVINVLSHEYGKERIMAGVDAKSGEVVVEGWKRIAGDYLSWADRFIAGGAGSLLYTNVDVEGLCKGIQIEPVLALLKRSTVPVIIAGGISSTMDAVTLKNAGADGIVLGSALYNGKITMSEILEAVK